MAVPLKRVVIVGGGSAGWITAAYMDAVLNGERSKAVDISLIESADVPRVGVGEATVPSLRDTLRTIGVDEAQFMRATDATFKQAIRFDDWLTIGHRYFHPFDRRPSGRLDRAGLRWLTSDRTVPFAATVSAQPALCEAGRAPKFLDSRSFEAPISYAYHVDAEKLATFLCELATRRGVRHIVDDVVDVDQDDDGRLLAVRCAQGLRLEGDLFVDCTGFAAILSGQRLGVDFVDYSTWLPCNRAVAMRIPFERHAPAARRPFTVARALSNGWKWDITLADRRGIGYVYAGDFLDAEAAERELRDVEGRHSAGLDVRHLQFRVGRLAEPWRSNCVAIGLSSGFIEPLESTGLFLVEIAVATLCEYFPFGGDARHGAAHFNAIMQERYEEILDFVVLHYCLSRRDDSAFWCEVREARRIPERLQARLQLWRHKLPSLSDFHDTLQLFSHTPYEYVLYGMDFLRERIAGQPADRLPATTVPDSIARTVADASKRLPAHDEWLARRAGAPPLQNSV
ncbi:MAG: tryptophan halogenase family protein [Pseudomonadota bacterium]